MVACGRAEGPAPAGGSDRLVGIGFETLVDSEQNWATLSRQLDEAGANGVSIAVGRPEWVAFPWPAEQQRWAEPVTAGRAGGEPTDLVQQAIDALRTDEQGNERSVTLAIDALAPLTIERNPEEAAVLADGTRSTEFPSAAAWESGTAGEDLVTLCGQVAQRYRPERIALTELIVQESFGETDLESFRRMSGQEDWPRTDNGQPDNDDDIVQRWRSQVVADLVQRCAHEAAAHDVAVEMDVRVNWDDPARGRPDSGHDYAMLLPVVDRLTVWAYVGLSDRPPGNTCDLVSTLRSDLPAESSDKVMVSVGLWSGAQNADGGVQDSDGEPDGAGQSGDAVLSPEAFEEAVGCATQNGTGMAHVTPESMMSNDHWAALGRVWAQD